MDAVLEFLTKMPVRRRLYFATMHSILFLLIKTLVPSAEEISLIIFAAGLLSSFAGVRRLVFLISGAGVAIAIHVILYERISGLGFDLHHLTQNPYEAMLSVILTFGNLRTILFIIEFAVTIFVSAWVMDWIVRSIENKSGFAIWLSTAILFVSVSLAARLSFFYLGPVTEIEVRFEGDPQDLPKGNQSLFMLQLESVNGPVLQDSRLNLPSMAKVLEMGGSTLPYFWGNHFGTNLGFASILCGASGAMTHRLVRPPDDHPCLPERFRRAGFETVYYYSYKASDFYRMEENVTQMGFQKFIYGDQLMEKSDPFYRWGYDDCRFYDRAFADMRKSGLDSRRKIFVYFSVHMNHVPFENHLTMTHPYVNPGTLEEKYLNSAIEQDYCVGRFLDHVRALKRNDINIVISGDHGFPVKDRHELYDSYMTRFQFIPSRTNKKKFPSKVHVEISPSQDQIQSTVLEMFGARRRPASFLWALAGETPPVDYRSCIMISDQTSNSAYAIDGNEVVRKSTILNRFERFEYQSGKLKEAMPLDRIADWRSVKMPRSCYKRLGIPKFN